MKAGIYQPAPIARATLRTIQGQRLKQSLQRIAAHQREIHPHSERAENHRERPLGEDREPEQRAGPKRPRRRFCSFGQREKRAIRSEDKKCEQHVRSRKGCSRCEAVCAHQERYASHPGIAPKCAQATSTTITAVAAAARSETARAPGSSTTPPRTWAIAADIQ